MTETRPQTLLVTGSSGFLGRAITKRAKANGLTPVALTRSDIDQTNGSALASLLDRLTPTFAIDAAGVLPGTGDVFDNVALTNGWLDALSRSRHAPRLVLIGSAAVYGTGSAQDRATVETDPMCPISDYGKAKLETLEMTRSAVKEAGLDVQTGVVFNLLGAGQAAHLAPQVFIQRALADAKAVQSVGSTDTIRDFADVEDVADALIGMARFGSGGDVLNIATGQPTRIQEILQKLQVKIGARWINHTESAKTPEIKVCYGDPSRLKERIDWQPRFSLDEALDRAIAATQIRARAERRSS